MERTKSPETRDEELHRPEGGESETFFEPTTASDSISFQREGLPSGYRMRHEEHYVDQLIASNRTPQLRLVSLSQIEGVPSAAEESLEGLIDSIQEFGVLQPLLVRRRRGRYELVAGAKRFAAASRAGLDEVPCLVLEVDETEARRLAEAANRHALNRDHGTPSAFPAAPALPLLEGTLETILSTLALLDKPGASLRDQVAIGLIRTEARRANRLLGGQRLLAEEPPVVRRPVELDAVLRDVLAESEEERGLLSVRLEAAIGPSSLRADARLVSLAFGGAIDSLLALLRSTRGALLNVRLSRAELRPEAILVVSEDSVRMPTSSWARWFDPDWEGRPGGYAAAVALLAARRAAELHGGRLEVSPTDQGGCRITVALPAGG